MIKLDRAISFLNMIEGLEPFNDRPKNARGFQVRTVLLLLSIMDDEGENQTHYKDTYGWSISSVSANTKTLLENGFIIQDHDERDPRGTSKRIYLTKGVREYLTKALHLEE
jgi:DNA-binding MarR family transcriptional regulator